MAEASEPTRQQEEDKSKTKRSAPSSDVDLEPNFFVVAGMFLAFTLIVGSIFYYKVDNRSPPGAFASWVNEKYPWIDTSLNRPRSSVPVFGAQAQEVTGKLSLTEEELKAYDGTDSEKPIYLGINGTIFDVSASPAFYGPGGHYNHFVGKDATLYLENG
ncbi:Membrane steroid-binding protein 2 [Pseudocercospora fuligena]|uniref:Membrane steroid-binding protein 2 n=1 Tax=Pseudocercospora fuligena TaxID=685502 RepID=A0A8H6RIC9_9PEZI|nr:Membrane steroid-binding protein 2 [Pseudocercospora fuligena]